MSDPIPFPKNAAGTLELVNDFDRMLRMALSSPQNFATQWPSLLRLLVSRRLFSKRVISIVFIKLGGNYARSGGV